VTKLSGIAFKNCFDAVVIGASLGGLEALSVVLSGLPKKYSIPIVVILHVQDHEPSLIVPFFENKLNIKIKEADQEFLEPNTIYFAPPSYHLLIEKDKSFSFSLEEPVQFCRPSIDVFFESAADCFAKKLLGIILTGANQDGARGLAKIKGLGGMTIVQKPESAQNASMPLAAIDAADPHLILSLQEIALFLDQLHEEIPLSPRQVRSSVV
jgi:two-component system chemotaxis response regulator CheB